MAALSSKSQRLWAKVSSSFWFIPTVIIAAAIGLALVLIEAEGWLEPADLSEWSLLLGAGQDGARALLSAVAGSMITVAGVVFSITLVALSLTASQYSPRVLRNFMRSHINQVVLGVFVGIFVYCLVVLRTVRAPDEGDGTAFVPSLAVFVGLLLGVVGVLVLVFFIHHISTSIQASQILMTAFEETMVMARRCLPEDDGICAEDERVVATPSGPDCVRVRAQGTGYLQAVDVRALESFAGERSRVLWVEREIGAFVTAGVALVTIPGPPLASNHLDHLRAAFSISHSRSLTQDVAFGIRQLVDVALRGLSPGINDTTTAVMAIDYLTALLRFCAARPIRAYLRTDDGELRVVLRVSTFPELVSLAFDQIRRSAAGNATVLARLLWSVEVLAEAAEAPRRRAAILEVGRSVAWSIRETIANPADQAELQRRVEQVLRGVEAPASAGG